MPVNISIPNPLALKGKTMPRICLDDSCEGNHCIVCGGHMVDFYGNGDPRECSDCAALSMEEKVKVKITAQATWEEAFPAYAKA